MREGVAIMLRCMYVCIGEGEYVCIREGEYVCMYNRMGVCMYV